MIMRAIRLTPNETTYILGGQIRMLLRECANVNFNDIEKTDFIVYPDFKGVQHIHSPGTLYVYKIMPIDDEELFEELSDLHKTTLADWEQKVGGPQYDKFPVFGLVFRFRPFKQPVAIMAVEGEEEFFDVKNYSAPQASIQLVENIDDYDPRLLDDIQLEDDWKIVTQMALHPGLHGGDDRPRNVGMIVLREILKRGIKLNLEDYKGESKMFLESVLESLKKYHLFSEYVEFEDFQNIRRDRCMNCEKPPEVDVLWAEGIAHAWFCSSCFTSWKDGGFHKPDKVMQIENGIAGRQLTGKNAQSMSPTTLEEEDLTVIPFDSLAEDFGVENRGGKNPWCVVHGHPKKKGSKTDKPAGSVIKCHPTEAAARKQHRAIIISQARQKGHRIPFPKFPTGKSEAEDFMAYPIAYIGSKRKLMEQIVSSIPQDVKFVVDGFSGCGVVSYTLRNMGMDVVGVDASKLSQTIFESIIRNKETKLTDDEMDWLLSSPRTVGHMATLADKAIHFDDACKSFMDGFRERAEKMEEPKRSLALSALLASAGTMVYAGYLRDSIHKKVHERMQRDRVSMLKLLKQGLSNCMNKFNQFVKEEGGKAHFVRSDTIKFIQSITKTPGPSMAYFDPPYVSETGSTKTYYKQYNAWEHALYGSLEGFNPAGEWTAETFEQRIDDLLTASASKFNYVLFSYRVSSIFPKAKLLEMFGKHFKNILTKRVEYKYINFPKKDGSPPEAEFIFLMSNQDLDSIAYRKLEFGEDGKYEEEDFTTDYHMEYPQIGNAKFLLQAFVNDNKVSLFLRRQLTKGVDVCMRLYKGSPVMDGYTEAVEYTLTNPGKGFGDVRKAFTKDIWPELKKDLKNKNFKFIAEPFIYRSQKTEKWDKEGWVGDCYVINLDSGTYDCLTIKDDYREFWFRGNVLKNMYSEKFHSGNWYVYHADRLPYVLTRQAENEGWMPPVGYTGLPQHVETQTPKHHRFWNFQERRKIRSDFRKELFSKLPGIEKELPVKLENPHDAYFSIQHQTYRGISSGDREHWHLNFVFGGQTYSFTCEKNPVMNETFSSLELKSPNLIRTDGYLPPGHKMNDSKSLLSHVEVVDEGVAILQEIKEDYMKLKVEGKKVNDVFEITGDVGIWTVRPEHPKTILEVDNEDFMITSKKFDSSGHLVVEGLLFRPGSFKGKTYPLDVVKHAKLEPWHRGQNLAYINQFHEKDEPSRIGIMTDTVWDPELEWRCVNDKKMYKGATRWRGIVTDQDGIEAIQNGTYQTSAEVAHELDYSHTAMWMAYTGVAICHSPAVDSSQLLSACQGDSCMTFPTGITPRHINN